MVENKVIKFAVVGCGHIGKRHAEMVLGNPNAKLVALCDVASKETLGIEKYDVPFYSSIEDLMDAKLDIDVVNICTPNGLHSDQASLALDNDYHIVVEKPIGLSKAKCEQVIFKALRNHKQVFAVMQNRYSPPSVWIKDLVENKVLGDIFMVQCLETLQIFKVNLKTLLIRTQLSSKIQVLYLSILLKEEWVV